MNDLFKQTKIIATMGPASNDPQMIEKLIVAGVNVFRINFSHSTHEEHKKNILNIRKVADKLSAAIAIMGDLQGPKIRVSKFENGKVDLNNGDEIILDTSFEGLGNKEKVGVDYKELACDLKARDVLLLDDGKISFQVAKVEGSQIFCQVIQGGVLKNNKGINKMGGGLTAPALTDKDLIDIQFAAAQGVDFIAVSFPKNAMDINFARRKLVEAGSSAKIIAKMERTEAVGDNMLEIVKASDGVMVARGDLAVEVGEALVPGLQKKLVSLCRKYHKISIVATQMLESMIESPVATRAEVSDIANAVLDGTDAVMLSAETASGNYPFQAVSTMARVCREAEKMADNNLELNFNTEKFSNAQQTIAMSALFTAYHMDAKALIALTASGATARWMSRVVSNVPIFGITNSKEALQNMAIYRGVYPYLMRHKATDPNAHAKEAANFLKEQHIINEGDTVVVTMGELVSTIGSTNSLKVLQV